ANLGRAAAMGLQPEGDVLGDREVWKQGVVLEHHADIALVRRQARDVLAVELDRAAIDAEQAGDDAQQGGLAAARRAEQRDELALGDGEIDATQDGGRPERLL